VSADRCPRAPAKSLDLQVYCSAREKFPEKEERRHSYNLRFYEKKVRFRSAFFNLRVLTGLFLVLASVFLALIGMGRLSTISASSAQAQQKHKIINIQGLPPGFDCSTIYEKGIDKQENYRASLIMIACGEAQGVLPSSGGASSQLVQDLLPAPPVYGGADVNVITGPETPPDIHQSETYTAANQITPIR
jgi:hypothetical protein